MPNILKPNANSGQDSIINKRHLPYFLDEGLGRRARIGVIVLPDDQTIEHELRMIFDLPGVAFFAIGQAGDLQQPGPRLALFAHGGYQ